MAMGTCVTAAGAQGSPKVIPVTLTVAGTQPILSLSPGTVTFTATAGGTNPAPASVSVSNTGTGTLTFTAASDSAWLSVTPGSGTAPQTLQVSADITGLAAGSYSGKITITASGAQGSPGTVNATLTVVGPPVLSVAPLTVSFAASQGGANPAASTVNVTNTGGGTINFTASSDSSWLTVAPTSGTAPRALQVSANISGLTQGTYTGHVTVSATGVQGSPATVTASLTVSPPATLVLGQQTVEVSRDSNTRGLAEAFQTTAVASGTVQSLVVYLDSTSTAGQIYLGLYADNNGHPGALLTQGNSSQLVAGTWNTVTVSPASVTNGTRYWIAILGTTSGIPVFRDRTPGSCKSEGSSQKTLTSLPATWTTGALYTDCPVSAYAK